MRVVFRHIQVLVVAAAGLSGPHAIAADASHGADLAKRWCATCHIVGGGRRLPYRRVAVWLYGRASIG